MSESQEWAKRDPKVVVRTVIEVNEVAKLQPQSERAQSCLCTSTRIKCRVQIGIMDAEHCTHYTAIRKQDRAKAKVDEPAFQRDEWTKMTTGRLELRSNQTLSNSYRSPFNRSYIATRDASVNLLEVNPVIVGEFSFYHHVAVYAVSEPSTHSVVVGLRLGNA